MVFANLTFFGLQVKNLVLCQRPTQNYNHVIFDMNTLEFISHLLSLYLHTNLTEDSIKNFIINPWRSKAWVTKFMIWTTNSPFVSRETQNLFPFLNIFHNKLVILMMNHTLLHLDSHWCGVTLMLCAWKCNINIKRWSIYSTCIGKKMWVVLESIFCINLPADKVSYDISMAHHDFITVFGLIRICTVKVLSKCCFDACTILIKLLNKMV